MWWKCEVLGHSVSGVRKQREINAGVQLLSPAPLLIKYGILVHEVIPPTLRGLPIAELNLFENTLTDTLRDVSPRDVKPAIQAN